MVFQGHIQRTLPSVKPFDTLELQGSLFKPRLEVRNFRSERLKIIARGDLDTDQRRPEKLHQGRHHVVGLSLRPSIGPEQGKLTLVQRTNLHMMDPISQNLTNKLKAGKAKIKSLRRQCVVDRLGNTNVDDRGAHFSRTVEMEETRPLGV